MVLQDEATRGGFTEIRDDFSYTNNFDSPRKHLPEFDFEFVQNGSHLIPYYQGLYITGHQNWNYLIGPGRIWKENSDNGWSRISFPFALVQRNSNCTHNGTMTLLFSGTAVSNVRYQVTQETCLYFKFNMWGELASTYTATSPGNAETIRNDHASEVAGRLPTKSISQLPNDYPSSGADFSAFGGGVTPAHMTKYGLLIADPTNGGVLTNYVSGCTTRFGEYPFCANIRVPSYSTAKTTFAGVSFMRLTQLNSGVPGLTIGNYVPEWTTYAPAGAQWNNVTFNNALDMATGHYRNDADLTEKFNDESGTYEEQFFLAETYLEKIEDALDNWPYKATPGSTFVYHTHDHFLLSRGLQNYLGSDLFSKIRDDVYTPLGVSKGMLSTLRTDNTSYNSGSLGQPFGGYGLFYNSDDVAKLAKLLNNDAGRIGATQVLNPAQLNAGMQRDANDRGLVTHGTIANQNYSNGIWGKFMTRAEFPTHGYTCDFWVPRMSGYGGIIVLMMPNGSTYWYFSDNDEFSWYNPIKESNKLRSMC